MTSRTTPWWHSLSRRAREHARALALVADRERIAHDLHDHVIQRLFTAGMDLQGTIARPHRPEITARPTRTIDDLQTAIDEIRTRIFALQPPAHCGGGFQPRVRDAVSQLTDNRDITTSVLISGLIDVVRGQLADHA